MRARSAGMDDPLGNTLVVEVEDLLPQHEIFQQRGAALPGAKTVLVIGNAMAEIVGQMRRAIGMVALCGDILMKFACVAGIRFGVCPPRTRDMVVERIRHAGRALGIRHARLSSLSGRVFLLTERNTWALMSVPERAVFPMPFWW